MQYTGRVTLLLVWMIASAVEVLADGSIRLWEIALNVFYAALAWTFGSLYDKASHLSERDFLTGLYNRRYIHRRASRIASSAARRQEPYAVLLLDINRFKQLNDTMGHEAGDDALRQLAKSLTKHVAPDHLVARWGGDEFVIVARRTGKAEAANLAERIDETLRREMQPLWERTTVTFEVSIGYAACPEQGQTFQELLRLADEEMYRVKRASAQ